MNKTSQRLIKIVILNIQGHTDFEVIMFEFSFSLYFAILPSLLAVDVKLLEPKTSSSAEVAVIITPGARISGEAYIPLGMSHCHSKRQ